MGRVTLWSVAGGEVGGNGAAGHRADCTKPSGTRRGIWPLESCESKRRDGLSDRCLKRAGYCCDNRLAMSRGRLRKQAMLRTLQ